MNNDELILKVRAEIDDKMSAVMAQINRQTDEMNRAFNNANKTVKAFESSTAKGFKTINKSFKSLNLTSLITFTALTAGFRKSINSAADFEYQIKKVQTVSNEAFEDIKRNAEEMSLKYGASVKEITEGHYQLISTMGNTSHSALLLNQNMMLAKAGFTDFNTAVDITSKVINAYGLEATEITEITDTLIQGQIKGAFTIGQLGQQFGRVIPTAASLGVGFKDVTTTLTFLTTRGMQANQAATTIDSALNELGKSSSEVSKQFYRITGTTFRDFIASGGEVKEAIKLLGDEAYKQGIRIEDFFSNKNAKKFAGTLYNDLDGFLRKQKEMEGSNGSLSDSFNKVTSTAKQSYAEIAQSITAVARKIGENIQPELEKVNEEMKKPETIDTLAKIGEWGLKLGGTIFAVKALGGAINWVKEVAQGTFGALKKGSDFINAKRIEDLKNIAKAHLEAARPAYDATGKMLNSPQAMKNFNDASKVAKEAGVAAGGSYVAGFGLTLKTLGAKILAAIPTIIPITIGIALARTTKDNPQISGSEKWGIETDADKLKNISEAQKKESERVNKLIKEYKELGDAKRNSLIISKHNQEGQENAFRYKGQNLFNDIPDLTKSLGLEQLAVLKEKLSRTTSLINEGLSNGDNTNNNREYFQSLISQREEIENLIKVEEKRLEIIENTKKKQKELEEFINSIQSDANKLISMSNLIGWDEDTELQQQVDFYTSKLKEMIENGWDKTKPELYAELKLGLDMAKGKQDEKYEAKESAKREEDRIKKQIEAQEKAYKDTIAHLNSMGDSLYKVGDALENEFIKSISAVVNSMSGLIESLAGQDGKGGLLGSLSNLTGQAGGFSFDSLGTLGGISSALGVAGAGLGVVTAIGSMFGSKDKSKEIEAKNQENIRKFEENTSAIKELTDKIKANTDTLRGLTNELISNLSKNPTLKKLSVGESAIGKMQSAIESNRKFSDLTAIEKGSKKTGPWYNKKKVDTFTEIGISDADLLKAAGFTNSTIESLNFDELKKFSDTIKDWDTKTLKQITGKNLTESGIDELKGQIAEYIKQIEMLEKEQADMFRAATLESFKGVEYLDTKALKEQYIKMYEDMGIDVSEYMDVIDELVEANSTLITSMNDVRDEIIAGNKSFTEAMGSYFSDIVHNASSILYDTMFSELDSYFETTFKDISEKLVEMKKEGKDISPTELFKDLDWSKLLEGDKLQKEMKEQIDEIKAYLIEMGVSVDIVESMFGDGKWEKLKSYLQSAMNAALDSGNFNDFSKSLGKSLYDNVKESLVKAFSESKLYKDLMDKFMPDFTTELDGAGSFEEAFDIIQKYLKDFEHKLQGNGLGFDYVGSGDKITANDASGGGYYTESTKEITININQEFNGQFYSEDTMYSVAKEGVKAGMKELNENGQILTSF